MQPQLEFLFFLGVVEQAGCQAHAAGNDACQPNDDQDTHHRAQHLPQPAAAAQRVARLFGFV
ncbi:MAG: hypothetical protein ACLRZH_17785 [Ruthenibacterium lactatiformans]